MGRTQPESEVRREGSIPGFPLVFLLLVSLLLSLPAGAGPIGWSVPRPLAPDSGAFVRQGCHAMDARDTSLWTVWFEERNSGQHILKAARFCNGSWSEPESVTSDTADLFFVEMAVDADLNPWAVWDVTRRYPDSIFCVWTRRQGDSWTTPDFITSDTSRWGSSSSVAPDPEQGIWVIWCRVEPPGDSISILSSHCATDSWTTPALIARFLWWLVPHDPVITASPHGKVRSVWTGALSSGIGLYSATWNGDSWENPEFIPGSSLGYWPSVCSDSVGGTWVTWLDCWSSETTYIRYAHHDGTGWTETGLLGIGYVHGGMLCCDDGGWIWAVWTHERPAADSVDICVRYFDGDSWSDRCVVTTCDRMLVVPRIAAALNRVWVTWTHMESETRWLLYYSHTLPSGIADRHVRKLEVARISPTIIRNVLFLPEASGVKRGASCVLLDISGRKVLDLHPGENDVRHLSPGVYFLRPAGTVPASGIPGDSPLPAKIILTR